MSSIINSVKKYFPTSIFGEHVLCKRCCLLSDNKLFLLEDSGCHAYVFDPESHQWDTLVFDNPIYDATALNNKKYVVVTSGSHGFQEIKIGNVHAKEYQRIGGKLKAVSTLNDNIVVHSDYRKLSVMDLRGNVVNTINTKYDPFYITSDTEGCIYWTNGNKNEVHCEQIQGSRQFIFQNIKIQCPSGLTLDRNGFLYVAGYSSNNVHKLTKDGQYLGEILKEQDGINHPCGIVVNSSSKELVILNEDGASICIYKV